MKVLFVPMQAGGPAHFIPLVALSKMLDRQRFKTAFLLPKQLWPLADRYDIDVLDVEHNVSARQDFRSELRAYGAFSPDVVVDDFSISTALATALTKIPRVTIQRTGTFPGGRPRNARHVHSLSLDVTSILDVTVLGIPQPRVLTDLFSAECKVVPGIRSIEQLPEPVARDPTYFFSGPLLGDDYLVEQPGETGSAASLPREKPPTGVATKNFEPLLRFFEVNAQRRKVFVTLGTIERARAPMVDAILRLIERDAAAVVSNIDIGATLLGEQRRQRYYHAPYLPLNFVSKNVDLIVHQCGSGTYHYPLLHCVPSVTIGTQCFDREDVAIRLHELGVSTHLEGPEERADFTTAFVQTIERSLTAEWLARQRRNIGPIREELVRTAAEFDFPTVLNFAVTNNRSARERAASASTPLEVHRAD